MLLHVFGKKALSGEGFGTEVALEFLHSLVGFLVCPQIRCICKGSVTGRAGERLLTRMSLEKPSPREGLFAVRTLLSLCGLHGFRLLRFGGVTLLINVCLVRRLFLEKDLGQRLHACCFTVLWVSLCALKFDASAKAR